MFNYSYFYLLKFKNTSNFSKLNLQNNYKKIILSIVQCLVRVSDYKFNRFSLKNWTQNLTIKRIIVICILYA